MLNSNIEIFVYLPSLEFTNIDQHSQKIHNPFLYQFILENYYILYLMKILDLKGMSKKKEA